MGATANRSCGYHVHLDAADLTASDIRAIVTRYADHESEIDAFMPPSRRGNANTYCGSVIEMCIRDRYKPGRSVLKWVQFAAEQRGPLVFGACAQSTVIVDHFVKAKESLPPQPAPCVLGAALHQFIVIEHKVV